MTVNAYWVFFGEGDENMLKLDSGHSSQSVNILRSAELYMLKGKILDILVTSPYPIFKK